MAKEYLGVETDYIDGYGLKYGTEVMILTDGGATTGVVIDNKINDSVPGVEPFVESVCVKHGDKISTVKRGDPIIIFD
jgi:hypothetical protein